MDKTRVYNQRKYSIGLILQNGAERVIHPGSFALLARDEIEYLASIAPSLFDGEKQLRLEDRALAAQLGFVDDAQAETLDAEAIRKRLSQRVPQVRVWLEGVTEPYLLDAICDVAAEMDLPASKLQLLKERMPEREFIHGE
ncbi:MAG TPA: hypothetical protein IAD24_07205 [Candidatus Aphodomorpha intestinavium]|uniref:Uncharacterized protein n=1 Tax=Candidatus Aphodomorpha intestinavium TaxID=2840672 RepID=A0A9D1SU51_9FIRM|nr:hypothetical protein [Candidatus Aphodomorpha intestinavium]